MVSIVRVQTPESAADLISKARRKTRLYVADFLDELQHLGRDTKDVEVRTTTGGGRQTPWTIRAAFK